MIRKVLGVIVCLLGLASAFQSVSAQGMRLDVTGTVYDSAATMITLTPHGMQGPYQFAVDYVKATSSAGGSSAPDGSLGTYSTFTEYNLGIIAYSVTDGLGNTATTRVHIQRVGTVEILSQTARVVAVPENVQAVPTAMPTNSNGCILWGKNLAVSANTVQVTTGCLNIRSGPDTGTGIIGKAADGSLFTWLDVSDDGKWYNVRTESGLTGWVSAAYSLRNMQGAQPEVSTPVCNPALPPQLQVGQKGEVVVDGFGSLRIRDDVQGGEIDRLPEGQEFTVLAGPVNRPSQAFGCAAWFQIDPDDPNEPSGWIVESGEGRYFASPLAAG